MTLIRSHSIEQQMLDALLSAASLPLDELEYEVALEPVTYYASTLEEMPANFATRIVEEVEWSLGLGLDPEQHAAAVAAAQRVLEPPTLQEPAPDAFLEMAYEDRVSGDQGE